MRMLKIGLLVIGMPLLTTMVQAVSAGPQSVAPARAEVTARQAPGAPAPSTGNTGLPQFDNELYQLGLLERGPRWTAETSPEIQKIQEGHMANINRMAQAGKLYAAGPIMDDGDLRGIFLFRAASVEEAEALAADDPAIKAGRLELTILPWFGTRGIGLQSMLAYQKNPGMKWTMKTHVLALLRRGPRTDQAKDEAEKIQADHLWHIRRLMDDGRLLAAGPFTGDGTLRGVFVFATESVDDARAWADADPAVRAGRLTVELHPWLVAKEVWPTR